MAKISLQVELNPYDGPESEALNWLTSKAEELKIGTITQREFNTRIKDLLMAAMHLDKIKPGSASRLANNLDSPFSIEELSMTFGIKPTFVVQPQTGNVDVERMASRENSASSKPSEARKSIPPKQEVALEPHDQTIEDGLELSTMNHLKAIHKAKVF